MNASNGGRNPFDSTDSLYPDGDEGRGRASRFFARVFENPENPLGWSVKVFSAAGVAVRVHLFTIIFVGTMLAWSIPPGHAGIGFMSLAMGGLLLTVLLHEFGHCFACRAVGGSADRIVILPIGGLALVRPPDQWKAHFVTAAGGPLVNLAIVPLTAVGLWAVGLRAHVLFNPLAPMNVLADPLFSAASSAGAWGKYALWWLHYVNLVVLAFNVLVPAYPLDGGRLLQASLWARLGYKRATEATVYIGYAVCMVLGVVGLVANEAILIVVAFLSGWACWAEQRRIRGELDLPSAEFALGAALPPDDDLEDPWTLRKHAKKREAEEHEQRELDRILSKIAATGMRSLSGAERRLLKKATERKRREG